MPVASAAGRAASELMVWLASDPTGAGGHLVLMIGDYNSYAKEDPVSVITQAGFTNLIESHLGSDAYSFAFDGQWGYLDYAFASPALVSKVTDVAEYHINADEPSVLDYNTDFKTPNLVDALYAPDQFRVSDHDPVIVGLTLVKSFGLYLRGAGGTANPPALLLQDSALTATTAKYRDAAALRFAGGNPWTALGSGAAAPTAARGTLSELGAWDTWRLDEQRRSGDRVRPPRRGLPKRDTGRLGHVLLRLGRDPGSRCGEARDNPLRPSVRRDLQRRVRRAVAESARAHRHHGGRRVLWRPQLRRPSRVLRRQEPGLRAQRDLSAVGIRMASGARLMAGMTVGHPRHSADAVRRPGARVPPGRAQPNRPTLVCS